MTDQLTMILDDMVAPFAGQPQEDIDRLKAIVRGNFRIEQEIAAMGVQTNPMLAVNLKINALVEFLIPDPDQKLAFEIHMQETIRKTLEEIRGEAGRAKLLSGVPQTGGLLRPGG